MKKRMQTLYRKSSLKCMLLAAGFVCLSSCVERDIVGARNLGETDGQETDSFVDSETDSDTSDTSYDTTNRNNIVILPFVLDFNSDEQGMNLYDDTWTHNATDGTLDADVTFTRSAENTGIDYFIGEGAALGGADLQDATQITLILRTNLANAGSGMFYLMSVESEGPTKSEETVLWYSKNFGLFPDEDWMTYTFSLDDIDSAQFNPADVTVFGIQIQAPFLVGQTSETDTAPELDEPVHVMVQVDQFIIE